MNTEHRPCSRQTIEQFLTDRLSAEEQGAFEEHLESCPSCRQRLEFMAAEGDWWTEARDYLAPASLSPGDALVEEAPLHALSGYLAPTDDPRMLGRLGGYEVAGVVGCGGMGVVLEGL